MKALRTCIQFIFYLLDACLINVYIWVHLSSRMPSPRAIKVVEILSIWSQMFSTTPQSHGQDVSYIIRPPAIPEIQPFPKYYSMPC